MRSSTRSSTNQTQMYVLVFDALKHDRLTVPSRPSFRKSSTYCRLRRPSAETASPSGCRLHLSMISASFSTSSAHSECAFHRALLPGFTNCALRPACRGQWDVVGVCDGVLTWVCITYICMQNTFVVGCKFSEKIIYPETFTGNPDFNDPVYSTEYGIYSPHWRTS